VASQAGATRYGVTGEAAGAADVSTVSGEDVLHVVPVVLVLLTLLLALGLRSLVAPLYLVASVALSYLASLGLAILIFQLLGHEPGVNFALPFFLFVFVMALGEDYNILVIGRIREESQTWPMREAVRRAILATGGTVTAAGLVLAGTFGVLAVVTTDQIRQIGAGLALGILLDTFVVRTLLVPSTAVLLGRANWWPSSLWRSQPADTLPKPPDDVSDSEAGAGRSQPEVPMA
jgi:RND superfamily putative drug exporter